MEEKMSNTSDEAEVAHIGHLFQSFHASTYLCGSWELKARATTTWKWNKNGW